MMGVDLADLHEILVENYGVSHANARMFLADVASERGVGLELCLGRWYDRHHDIRQALEAEGWLHPTFYSHCDGETKLLPFGDLLAATTSCSGGV